MLLTVMDLTTLVRLREEQIRCDEEIRRTELIKHTQICVSHNMKAPIQCVTQMAQALLDQQKNDERENEMIHGIKNASMGIGFLMDDLLDRSMLENGKFTQKLSFFMLNDAVREVGEVLKIQLNKRGNELVYLANDNVPHSVRADKNRLQQVLINLITNANKFQSNNPIKIFCSLKQSPLKLMFRVEDQGIGILEQDYASLFKPFSKLAHGSNLNPNGTGLGLNICRQILEKLGGKIWLSETSDRGSSFSFTIEILGKTEELNPLRSQEEKNMLRMNKRRYKISLSKIPEAEESQFSFESISQRALLSISQGALK